MKAKSKAKEAPIQLPAGIKAADCKYPDWESGDKHIYEGDFELWYTEQLGWVIPTLHISSASRRAPIGTADRTYAVQVNSGEQCRVGLGPHVLSQVKVYMRESRKAELQKYIDLKRKGEIESNEIRDRISTRRAKGQVMRAEGRRSWLW